MRKLPTKPINWEPLLPTIISMTQRGHSQAKIADAHAVSHSALNCMMARRGITVARIRHEFRSEQVLQRNLQEVDNILDAVMSNYGARSRWPATVSCLHESFARELYKRAKNQTNQLG